jgi:uroporphyrinogen-III synthase
MSAPRSSGSVPILLLKTASTPTDSYEELLSAEGFSPRFIPVLLHQFMEDGLSKLRSWLRDREINNAPNSTFGGLIFTSQRAVEAFAKVVEEGKGRFPHVLQPIFSRITRRRRNSLEPHANEP